MNGEEEASPWVTAGRSHVDGTPGGGDEQRGGVMSALKVGPGVTPGIVKKKKKKLRKKKEKKKKLRTYPLLRNGSTKQPLSGGSAPCDSTLLTHFDSKFVPKKFCLPRKPPPLHRGELRQFAPKNEQELTRQKCLLYFILFMCLSCTFFFLS